jgi:hypothetical protein
VREGESNSRRLTSINVPIDALTCASGADEETAAALRPMQIPGHTRAAVSREVSRAGVGKLAAVACRHWMSRVHRGAGRSNGSHVVDAGDDGSWASRMDCGHASPIAAAVGTAPSVATPGQWSPALPWTVDPLARVRCLREIAVCRHTQAGQKRKPRDQYSTPQPQCRQFAVLDRASHRAHVDAEDRGRLRDSHNGGAAGPEVLEVHRTSCARAGTSGCAGAALPINGGGAASGQSPVPLSGARTSG